MNDMNKVKEQYAEKYPGFRSYVDCMGRTLLTGLATFGLTFSGTYFAQYLLQVRLPVFNSKPKTRLVAPSVLAVAAAYVVTSKRTQLCQRMLTERQNKRNDSTQQQQQH